MIIITTEGVEDLLQGLSGMQRQIPYAVANGLNVTARRVKYGIQRSMQTVFDRPTPFVINSLQLTPALAQTNSTKVRDGRTIGPVTTASLVAEVWFKDPPNLGTKGHFLLPQVEGGKRPIKPFEMGMGGRFVVPSQYTNLDQYGNLGRGQITKLLSISGGFHEIGFTMNARSDAKRRQYFRLLTRKGKLPPGIYERVMGDETGAQVGRYLIARAISKKDRTKGQLKELRDRAKALYPRGAQPVVLFPAKKPSYTKRLDFYGIAEGIVASNYEKDIGRAVAAEIENELAYRARKGLR